MMKIKFPFKILIILFLLIPFSKLQSQDFSTPVSYMSYIGEKEREVSVKYLNYISAASHGKSLRKVDKLRQQLINSIYETRIAIQGVPPYKGDRSLRDASVAFLQLYYRVINEDYAKIVNMEDVAEQSYDAMEAYMLAQKLAEDKLDQAITKRNESGKEFAAKNNINLIDISDALGEKMKKSTRVTEYYNKVYLIFFKCYKQEGYLVEAMNKGNVLSIEQNKNSLLKFANEGLEILDTLSAFDSDASLRTICQKALRFYKDEADDQASSTTDFFLKKENFEKMQKAFNSKPAAKRTKEDIDNYNKEVNAMNKSNNEFNKANNEINKKRTDILNSWNDIVKKYWDNHMPYARG